jgi:hypothetical protein
MRLVLAEHRDRIRAMQLPDGGLHGVEQIAFVQAVHQVADHFRVCLAREFIALGFQPGAQLLVVFDDAVVDERDSAGLARCVFSGTVAEVGMCVVHGRHAVRRPARVGNAGRAVDVVLFDLAQQFGDAVGTARPLEAARVHRDTARVIAPVLQALEALDEDGDNIARRDGADDATHEGLLD